MRRHAFLKRGAALLSLAVAAASVPALAQDRGDGYGGVYIDNWEEPPVEDSQTAPVANPHIYTVPFPAINVMPPVLKPAVGPAPAKPEKPRRLHPFEDRALNDVTSSELVKFASEAEFARWARRHARIIDRYDGENRWWGAASSPPLPSGTQPILVAAAFQDATGADTADVCADPEACPEEERDLIVTASRISNSPQLSVTSAVTVVNGQTITNTQAAGVDEGDIVKQIGDYLLVLQDGRIFATHIGRMQVTDRMDVWRKDEDGYAIGADWYDEMLIEGDRILIMAYSYRDDASELSVFKLDQETGRIARQGVFLISSDDYYSSENYATRIIGNKLILYTPYELEDFAEREKRPFIRRWQSDEEREDDQQRGDDMVEARDIYWPVQRIKEPWVHTVSVCPLGDFSGDRVLACETTGFVAPGASEFYVSPENIYLWTSSIGDIDTWDMPDCSAQQLKTRPARADTAPGILFRQPVDGSAASMFPINGGVRNQFAMDEFNGRFRALARWEPVNCEIEDGAATHVALYDLSLGSFTTSLEDVFAHSFAAVPSPNTNTYENRFADGWLVYGGRSSWRGRPPEDEGLRAKEATIGTIALPVRRPNAAQVLVPGHNVIRAERLGNDMLINGYGSDLGLNMTMLKLGDRASIGGTSFLKQRYESEGRSHAFNARFDADGGGLMGLPTVFDPAEGGRAYWRSQTSDLSFVRFSREGALADAGEIAGADPEAGEGTHPDYKCEVSCIDWYGNTRPIFLNGRIFGLMGTSLVEGRLDQNGKIAEVARLDLSAPITR